MKGKILYAKYDKDTGVSTVTKQTKYGTFTKNVKVHPDDFDIANQYDGCHFAELKCDIAAYRERAKMMREREKGIVHAYKVAIQADIQSGFLPLELSENTYWVIARQAEVAKHNADQAYETYKILKDSYNALVETTLRQRREMRRRIEKRRQK